MLRTMSIDEKITIRGKIVERLPIVVRNSLLIKGTIQNFCDLWWIVSGTPIQYAFVPNRWRKKRRKVVDRKVEIK